MIAADFNLSVGSLDDTGYIIPAKVEDNKTLFDIIQDALDDTMTSRKKMYVLYDDFGRLMLKDIENMKVNILIDETTGQNYTYESSIDDQTYKRMFPYF